MRLRDAVLWGVGLWGAYQLFVKSEEGSQIPPGSPPAGGYGPGYPPASMPPYPPMPRHVLLNKETLAKMGMIFLLLRERTSTGNWDLEQEESVVENLLGPSIQQVQDLGMQTPLAVLLVWGMNIGTAVHPSMRGFDALAPFARILESPLSEPERIYQTALDALSLYQRGVVPHPFKVGLLQIILDLVQAGDLGLQGPVSIPGGPMLPAYVDEQTIEDYLRTGSLPSNGSSQDAQSIFNLYRNQASPEPVGPGYNPNIPPGKWPGQ